MDNDIEIQIDPENIVIEQAKQTGEHFTISSDKASEILGINRTRLSQLTSKGLFPYERRKVQSRSRLFYRLNDLLSYQRRSSFGNLHAAHIQETLKTNAIVPISHTNAANIAIPPQEQRKQNTSLTKPHVRASSKRVLKSALETKTIYNQMKTLEGLTQKIFALEVRLNTITQLLQQNQEQAVAKKTQLSRLKKSVFQRPRAKRVFKVVKR